MRTILKHTTAFALAILLAFTFTSCKKEGTGGKSSVKGNVKHHSKLIPNAVVYIKYGATEFPGTDGSQYDDKVTADANAHFEFSGLQKGDYYLFAEGVDVGSTSFPVVGGVGIELRRNEALTMDVPVTE